MSHPSEKIKIKKSEIESIYDIEDDTVQEKKEETRFRDDFEEYIETVDAQVDDEFSKFDEESVHDW